MRIDPYKHREKYQSWKDKTKKGIKGISKANSDLILKYVNDMEVGLNVAHNNKKGGRSFVTLNNIRQRMTFLAGLFESKLKLKCVTDISEEKLFNFFQDMRNGNIRRVGGSQYQSVGDFIRIFKAFWHWWIKINKKQGKEIKDITEDLDTRQDKPKWVYLNEKEVKLLCENAKYDYKVLFMFLFDTGIRSPTELLNIKVSDLQNNYKELDIRQETSKTFGRRIKLMICSELLKDYVKIKSLKETDILFNINYKVASKYLKRLAIRLFGDKISPAGEKYSNMTPYDFRHISCCYWLPRYKSESALKYRFGWKKSDKIHYYSELLGMKDTIAEEDMLIDVTKTEIEKEMQKTRNENELLKDKVDNLQIQISRINELTEKLTILFEKNEKISEKIV